MRAILATMVLALAAPAYAQAPPPSQPGTGAINAAESYRSNMRNRSADFNALRLRNGQDQVAREAERQERADRLSAMANAGQCTRAIAIARREGDAEMAASLTEFCRRARQGS